MLRSVSVSLLAAALCATPPASAQSNDVSLRLVVEEGTPLRVALDRRVVIKRVGQQVEAVLVDPIFALRSHRHSHRDTSPGPRRATHCGVEEAARPRHAQR